MAVFATVLALAACGTEVNSPPTGTNLPVSPSTDMPDETGEGESASSGPAATDATAATTPVSPTEPAPVTATTGEAATTGGVATETATGTAGEAEATEEPAALPGFAAPDDILQQDPGLEAQLRIDDVRLGLQDGFDRVVLDLSGTGAAGWFVSYQDDPVLDGIGTPVDLSGEFVLQVIAVGMAYPEPGDTAYDPALLLLDGGDLSTVTEVLRTGPFEGQVPVFIGTNRQAPFRVFTLSDPARLVIDIQH